MQKVFSIVKKGTDLYLNRAGYFDLLDNRIYLFFSRENAEEYLNNFDEDCEVKELSFNIKKEECLF